MLTDRVVDRKGGGMPGVARVGTTYFAGGVVREPENKFDPNAIRVDSGFGQIGYIPADTAANNLASLMDRGHKVKAEISEITGGVAGKRTRGVNLQISVFDPIPQQQRAA